MSRVVYAVSFIVFFLVISCGRKDPSDNINVDNFVAGDPYVATDTWDEEPEEETSPTPAPAIVNTCALTVTESGGDLGCDNSALEDPQVEEEPQESISFSRWVEQLGSYREKRKCLTLSSCLKNKKANLLYDEEDEGLNVYADCADLPVMLRAYYAYKTKKPFSYVSQIEGSRYTVGNEPSRVRNYTHFDSISDLFRHISLSVHSGFYRTAPLVEGTDTYPVDITRDTVKPGTVFYDPNGHVLVVYKVEDDGTVRMMDGHPDNSLTIKRFNESFAQGKPSNGGGFRAWRKYSIHGTREEGSLKIVRDLNSESFGFDENAQFKKSYTLPDGSRTNYHGWVRFNLSLNGSRIDAVNEFRERVKALCVDIFDRINAVNAAHEHGISSEAHPDELPDNIYGTHGDWETWSSPSRDARFKASASGLYNFIKESLEGLHTHDSKVSYAGSSYKLVREYKSIWDELRRSPECNYEYVNSFNGNVPISISTVIDRVWDLSFDPYHCPELRWGAEIGSGEFMSCPDDELKITWYINEQRLRNSLDRVYDRETGIDFGPEEHIDVNFINLIDHYLVSISKTDSEDMVNSGNADVLGPLGTFDCVVVENNPAHFGAPMYKEKHASFNNEIASVFYGDKVKVVFESGSWYKVSYHGHDGWMLRDHLGSCSR